MSLAVNNIGPQAKRSIPLVQAHMVLGIFSTLPGSASSLWNLCVAVCGAVVLASPLPPIPY